MYNTIRVLSMYILIHIWRLYLYTKVSLFSLIPVCACVRRSVCVYNISFIFTQQVALDILYIYRLQVYVLMRFIDASTKERKLQRDQHSTHRAHRKEERRERERGAVNTHFVVYARERSRESEAEIGGDEKERCSTASPVAPPRATVCTCTSTKGTSTRYLLPCTCT